MKLTITILLLTLLIGLYLIRVKHAQELKSYNKDQARIDKFENSYLTNAFPNGYLQYTNVDHFHGSVSNITINPALCNNDVCFSPKAKEEIRKIVREEINKEDYKLYNPDGSYSGYKMKCEKFWSMEKDK